MKGIIATGAAALVVGIGATVAIAQQAPRPYYVGNALGLPIAPPAPTAENPNPPNNLAAISSNVKVYGAVIGTESCTYDPVRDLIIGPARGVGQAIRANDAFVAFFNHDGSVHTARWIGVQNPGAQRDNMTPPLVLNEPFGSIVWNGMLYLADRDGGTPDPANAGQNTPSVAVVRVFDMATGMPVRSVTVPGSGGLNDIAVAADGTIYGTNTGTAPNAQNPDTSATWQIWKIAPDDTVSLFLQGAPLNRPNGIEVDGAGNIVVVNIGDSNVITLSPTDASVVLTEQAVQAGNDGLVIMADGTKFVSSVTLGGISMIRPGQPAVMIAENIPSAASMCYDAGANQLVVPMNANNGLAFVSLNGIWAP